MRRAVVVIGLIALLVLGTFIAVHAATAGTPAEIQGTCTEDSSSGLRGCPYICPYCPTYSRACDASGRCC